MNSVRTTLKTYDIRPRKRLGQSFLEDEQMIRRIAALADPQREETIVEIGAGLGLLTEELVKKAAGVIALEIDPRLIAVLRDRFAGRPEVKIVAGDVLDYDFSGAREGGKIKVVGNIPYHISTPILFRLLSFRRSITSMVLMFQKELADRIMAQPGKKQYGIPSVIVARYALVSPIFNVPPTCFYPVPEVISSVLRFVMREDPTHTDWETCFVATVRAAFAQRRKTLRNNLRAAGVAEETLDGVFRKSGIDGARRAETLNVNDFDHLTSALRQGDGAEKLLDKDSSI